MNSFFFPQACDLQVACYALFHYEIESPDVQEMLNFHEVWFMCIISVCEIHVPYVRSCSLIFYKWII